MIFRNRIYTNSILKLSIVSHHSMNAVIRSAVARRKASEDRLIAWSFSVQASRVLCDVNQSPEQSPLLVCHGESSWQN